MEKQKLKERKINSHITHHTSNNKGITLVALIITIIVLLILAVVAIRAVQGDGIIQHAKDAKSKTTVAQEQEQIILAVNEWKIQKNYQNEPGSFKSFMEDKLSDVASIPGSDPDAGPLTVTMRDTLNQYIVYDNGTIGEPWKDNGDGTLTKGSETVKIGETTYDNDYVKDKLGATGGTYTGTWTVIGTEGEKLKLVSTVNVTALYYLGYEDPEAKKNVPVTNEDYVSNKEKLKRGMWSYAHVVDTLDKEAQTKTGIESARSITIEDIYNIIGEENVDKTSDPNCGKTFKYYCDDTTNGQVYYKIQNLDGTWPTTGSRITKQPFTYTNSNKETVTIGTLADGTTINKGEVELQYNKFRNVLTIEQKTALGCLATKYQEYWIASPWVSCYNSYASFSLPRCDELVLDSKILYYSYAQGGQGTAGVRAVVLV